jgi:hypothetical protein
MARTRWLGPLAVMTGTLAGCATGPVPSNPLQVTPFEGAVTATEGERNPMWIPQRPEAYALVFDTTYNIVNEYFPIAYSNRFDGVITTEPLMTAGYFDGFGLRLGYYSHYENLESTLQTVRRFAVVKITPADTGGYYIEVKVQKELEDLSRPQHGSAGAAIIRVDNPIERQFEVISPDFLSKGWIPFGQDRALEQVILLRLKECL